MAQIFISYAREDRAYARALAVAFERHDLTVWWDRQLPVGRPYADEIERELDGARCVVVLWSPHAIESDWVKAEAAEGAARRILVPVVIQSVRVPLEFRRLQAADLVGWNLDPATPELDACIEAVKSLVEQDETGVLPSGSRSATLAEESTAAKVAGDRSASTRRPDIVHTLAEYRSDSMSSLLRGFIATVSVVMGMIIFIARSCA